MALYEFICDECGFEVELPLSHDDIEDWIKMFNKHGHKRHDRPGVYQCPGEMRRAYPPPAIHGKTT